MGSNYYWGEKEHFEQYPAYFMAVTGIPTHNLHESLAIAFNDRQVLSLQFGESIFRSCETLPHSFPSCNNKTIMFL